MTGNDAADLTALLGEFGGLWEITKTPEGYMAKRRPLPASPLIFTAETVPDLWELLEHGYDAAKLADLLKDFAAAWDIEHLDPGSVWVAVSRGGGPARVITARDLDSLKLGLGRETPGTTDHPAADVGGPADRDGAPR